MWITWEVQWEVLCTSILEQFKCIENGKLFLLRKRPFHATKHFLVYEVSWFGNLSLCWYLSIQVFSFVQEDLEIELDDVYQPGSVLDMPKRPDWDYNMPKHKLLAREERYFRVSSPPCGTCRRRTSLLGTKGWAVVRNPGVYKTQDWPHHPTLAYCPWASYHLHNTSWIPWFLTVKATEQLVHVCISSTLDMCNALLYVLQGAQIKCLQKIQNCAACLMGAGVREYMTRLKTSLWLPVCQQINKVIVQVYRALHWQSPSYTVDVLQLYRPFRSLWSASDELLVVPRCRTILGDRATFLPLHPPYGRVFLLMGSLRKCNWLLRIILKLTFVSSDYPTLYVPIVCTLFLCL